MKTRIEYLDTGKLTVAQCLPLTTAAERHDMRVRARNVILYGLRHAGRVALLRVSSREKGRPQRLALYRVDDPVVTPSNWVATYSAPIAEDFWPEVFGDIEGELE